MEKEITKDKRLRWNNDEVKGKPHFNAQLYQNHAFQQQHLNYCLMKINDQTRSETLGR